MDGNLNRTFHRETILRSGVANETIARQHGSTGVYAGIKVAVHALAHGKGTMFAWNAGANIPAKFATAIARGVRDVVSSGVSVGLELTDVLVSIEDGSYHDQDSNEAVFREVAQKATISALRQAHPIILEAISICHATFPNEYTDGVEAIVSSEKGQIQSVQSELQNANLTVSVLTSRVDNLLQRVLIITDGRTKFFVEGGGFLPKPEPPEPTQYVSST